MRLDDDKTVDFFQVARLRSLAVSGSLLFTLALPPLQQLHTLACVDLRSAPQVLRALSLMSGLPWPHEVRLQINQDDWMPVDSEPSKHAFRILGIPPTTSSITAFSMGMKGFQERGMSPSLSRYFQRTYISPTL